MLKHSELRNGSLFSMFDCFKLELLEKNRIIMFFSLTSLIIIHFNSKKA